MATPPSQGLHLAHRYALDQAHTTSRMPVCSKHYHECDCPLEVVHESRDDDGDGARGKRQPTPMKTSRGTAVPIPAPIPMPVQSPFGFREVSDAVVAVNPTVVVGMAAVGVAESERVVDELDKLIVDENVVEELVEDVIVDTKEVAIPFVGPAEAEATKSQLLATNSRLWLPQQFGPVS